MLQVSIRCYYALKGERVPAAENSVMVSDF